MIDIGSMYSRIEADTSQLKKAESDISAFAGKAAGLFAGIFTASKAIEFAKTVTFATARFETMGVVMNNVGKNAGYSASQMESYELALRKTGISMTSTRETLTKLAQANIDLAQSQDLARIAQDAAVIGNINSSEAFERMIRGIQAGEVEILRNIGINVSFQKSYEDLAAKLKISTKELTEQEKTQARANAVLAEGAKIFGTYEAAMETPMKKFLSLQRYVEDTSVLLGKLFQPAFGTMVDSATDHLKEFQKALDQATLKEWGDNLNSVVKTAGGLIKDYGGEVATFTGLIIGAKVAQLAFNTAVKANPYVMAAGGLLLLNEQLKSFNLNIGSLPQKYQDLSTSVGNLIDVARGLKDANTGELLTADQQELNKTLDETKEKLKEVREGWAFTPEARAAKEQNIASLKEQVEALEKQKIVLTELKSLGGSSTDPDAYHVNDKDLPKPEPPPRPGKVDTSYGRDLNALAKAQLDYQESIQEKKLALTQQGIEKELLLNEQGYELGTKSYQEYFDTRQAKTEELLKMELSAREEQLANAKQAAENISDIIDKDGAVDAEKTSKAKITALKEVEVAQKEVYEAEGKLNQAQIEGAHESKLANLERIESYKNIQVQLLEMQGSAVEAAKLQAEIDEQSLERRKLIAEADKGNAEAQKALAAQRLMSENSIKAAEIDSLSRKQEALLAIAEIDGEHQKSREIQIQLLDIEIARAELNGKKKEEIDLLRRQRQELERMLDPLSAMVKGWEDVVKASTDANKMIYEFGRNTAQNTYDAFSDILFDGFDTGFKNIGDIAQDTWDVIYKSFLRMLADMLVAWGASEIASWFGYGSGGSFSFSVGGSGGSGGGGSNSVGGTVGGLATSAATAYVKDYIWTNGVKPAATAAYDYVMGTTTSLGSTGSGVGLEMGGGLATEGYTGGMTGVGYEMGGTAAAETGATIGTAAADAMMTAWASNAAADAAGTYAASATAAEFGTTAAASGTAGAAGSGAGAAGSMAASSGPAAIIAMLAVWAGMDMADQGRNKFRDKLNESRVTPTGFGMVGGIETDGELTRLSEEARDALYLLNESFGNMEAVSIDAASGVMVLANNIVGEGGLITGVNYGIETFNNATGAWERSQVEFSDLLNTMSEMGPVSSDAISATASYVAEMAGVPTVADELAIAFIELQTGIYGVAGAAVDGAGIFANAASMMSSIGGSGLIWSGGNNVAWEDQSNADVRGSQAWVAAGGGSTPVGNDGYGANYLPDDFGMATGGVVDKLLVPSADDGFAALSFGEGVIDRSTMEVLSAAIKDGSFGKSQPITIHLSIPFSPDKAEKYIISVVDKQATIRQRYDIQGARYPR